MIKNFTPFILWLTWLSSWAMHAYVIDRYGMTLPHADEWILTPYAVGQEPLTFKWLFTPANEHRAPLTRLVIAIFGSIANWDWKIIRQLNLAFLAIASLTLLEAAKKIRGRRHFADAGLIIVALSPAPIESLHFYGYSFVVAAGFVYWAVAELVSRAPEKSFRRATGFLALCFAITLSGGPAGNLITLGLLFSFWGLDFKERAPAQRRTLFGLAVIVAAVSVAFIGWAPQIKGHVQFHSGGILQTLSAAAKLLICPLGPHWQIALIVLALLYFLPVSSRAVDYRRYNFLIPLAVSYVALALSIGRERGSLAILEHNRYQTFFIPLALLALFTLLWRNPNDGRYRVFSIWVSLTLLLAWPLTFEANRTHYQSRISLERELQRPDASLTDLAQRWYKTYYIPKAEQMRWCLEKLRENRQSLFGS